MLNSEGYITGDNTGKIRAWIIGFNSIPTQPEQLDIIEELTEHSEKSNMHSHRSQQSLHNFQTNSSSSIEHQPHQRPSFTFNQESGPQLISPQYQSQPKAIVFPDLDNKSEEQLQQINRKEQILNDVKNSFKKKSKEFISSQQKPILPHQNNRNAQILIQESQEDTQNYPNSNDYDEEEEDGSNCYDRENKSETIIRNNLGDVSPPVIHSDDVKKNFNKAITAAEEQKKKIDINQNFNQLKNPIARNFQNNSENNLNNQEMQDIVDDESSQNNNNNKPHFNQFLHNDDSGDHSSFSSPYSPKIAQNVGGTGENNNSQGQNQNTNSNSYNQDNISSSSSHKRINLNLPMNLLKQTENNNPFGQKNFIPNQNSNQQQQQNETHEIESDSESLPIQQTLNLLNQKNNHDQVNPFQQNLTRQSNSQISTKSDDKNIFTQTVSRLINPENQANQNNIELPAHRRFMSNTTHQSEDTSFENLNAIPNQVQVGFSGQKIKQPNEENKGQLDNKEDYNIIGDFQNNQKLHPQIYKTQKSQDDDIIKQMLGSGGKFNTYRLNNIPSVLSHQEDDPTEESIVLNSSVQVQDGRSQPKVQNIGSLHKIKDIKEPEHNSDQLTKLLNSQDNNKIKIPQFQQVQSFYEIDNKSSAKQQNSDRSCQQHIQQISILQHQNDQLQKKIEELLSLNGKLSNDKEKLQKDTISLKQDNEELQRRSSQIDKEKISKMYEEIKQKMDALEKVKEEIIKSTSQPLQKKIYEQLNEISDLKKKMNDLQEKNQELNKALIAKDSKASYSNEHQISKDTISLLKKEVLKLNQQEVSMTQKIVQLEDEILQLRSHQKDKNQEIENLKRQLRQNDQINGRNIPAINTTSLDYKPQVLHDNNNPPSSTNSNSQAVMVEKLLETYSENEKLKKRNQAQEKQIEQLEKQLNIYSQQSNKNSTLETLSSQKELQIAFQPQQANNNNSINRNGENTSHRKTVSYIDVKPSSDNNKSYDLTINVKREQNPEKQHFINDTYNNQKQQLPNNSTQQNSKNTNLNGGATPYANNAHRTNQSIDIGNIQRNHFNVSTPLQQNKVSTINNEQKLHYTPQQKLQEITNQQQFYTPYKTASSSISQNINSNNQNFNNTYTNLNTSNNNIQNTSSQSNTSLTPRAMQLLENQKYLQQLQQQQIPQKLQQQQYVNTQSTPPQQNVSVGQYRLQRGNQLTLNSDMNNSTSSFDQIVKEIQFQNQSNNSTKFLQIPTPNKLSQMQIQNKIFQTSPSPQKTANPQISSAQKTLYNNTNTSLNAPQTAAFFNTQNENSKTSVTTTPQRIGLVNNANNQLSQQKQYSTMQAQPAVGTNLRLQNTNNYQIFGQYAQKKPIFDQSPQGRQVQQVLRVPNSDEKLRMQNISNILQPSIDSTKISGNNSFRTSDQDFDHRYQGSPFNLGNIQPPLSRRFDDQSQGKKRKQIFNTSVTPPRTSLNNSIQYNIVGNNNVNSSYIAPFPVYDGQQYSNR